MLKESTAHLVAARKLQELDSTRKVDHLYIDTRATFMLINEVNKPMYSDKILQHYFSTIKLKYTDSTSISRLVNTHAYFNAQLTAQYNQCYIATQKVFRAYLVDSQRIGLYVFLMALFIFSMAAYYNFVDNNYWNEPEADDSTPWDSPKKFFFIQVIAIALLLVPLARPIQPEDIDPEKPYWMISLSNWHVPTTLNNLLDSSGSTKGK
jgi:hypothetical protein